MIVMPIIAVTGLIGSGKDEVASYLYKEHGFVLFDHSVILETILKEQGRPVTRQEKRNLRIERGNAFTAELINQEIRSRNLRNVVIGSLRRPEEVIILKDAFPDAKLLVVKADFSRRLSREQKRAQYSDAPETEEDFYAQDQEEERLYEFSKTFAMADAAITNNGSLEELHREIDRILKNL